MLTELDLTRGAFLEPVVVRAVRAAGVQAGLDLARLGQAADASAAVARTWAAGQAELLRVTIEHGRGALEVRFHAPRDLLALALAALPAADEGAARPDASLVDGAGDGGACLRLAFA